MCPRTAAARPTQTVTNPAAIGGATTLLGDATTTLVDWGNTVNIVLTQGTLQSDTEQNVFAGKNAAALGAEGRWEIIQWETAILETDGSYTLSNLLRGRKGTEHNVGLHEVGDVFIALTPTSVIRLHPSTSELDQQRLYKPVSRHDAGGKVLADWVGNQGSGDFSGWSKSDGFVELASGEESLQPGAVVPFRRW